MRLASAMVLVGFVALPLSASAQAGEEGTTPEQNLEEPALQLELDDAGVSVTPGLPRTIDGYTLEEMEVRVLRAKIGIISSVFPFLVGWILVVSGVTGDCGWLGDAQRQKCDRLAYAGTALAAGGAVGMIVNGAILGKRKRELRELQQAHYRAPRRVRWDLARSALVF